MYIYIYSYACVCVYLNSTNVIMQVKEFKQALPIPKILPTPGSFQGAQFEFVTGFAKRGLIHASDCSSFDEA